MKKFFLLLVGSIGIIFLIACLSGGAYFWTTFLPKPEPQGYSNPVNTNRQVQSTTTTPTTASTTIATVAIPPTTSTLHLVANIIANHSTSTDGASYVCNATYKRTGTPDVVTQIGTYTCPGRESVAAWDVGVSTTNKNVILEVKGANNVNWTALVETYITQ